MSFLCFFRIIMDTRTGKTYAIAYSLVTFPEDILHWHNPPYTEIFCAGKIVKVLIQIQSVIHERNNISWLFISTGHFLSNRSGMNRREKTSAECFYVFMIISLAVVIPVEYNIFTVGPNGPKLKSWEHIWAYLCKEFSYSHHLWPDDSGWGYKKLNKPNWPWLTLDDLEMSLENIFFSACPSFNRIFSPKLCENEKSALIWF